jgi:DNA-3-methyladenine glycosylase I
LALGQRGFGVSGPVICYSYMQAIGMVNDHTERCFRYPKLEHKLDSDNEKQGCQNRS